MDTDTNETTRWRKVALVGAGLALAVPLGAVATSNLAGASVPTDDDPEVIESEVSCELTEEDLAAWNDDSDALATFLAERGIAHTVTTDGDGYREVEYDDEDEAVWTAVDEFYAERYPLTPEELAEINDESDALAAFLAERGIAHTVETEADGTRWVEYDDEDEAVWTAVDEFYAARYPLTEEEIAEINAEADLLAARFTEQGIAFITYDEPDGTRWVEWDYEDDAPNAVADEVYDELYDAEELTC